MCRQKTRKSFNLRDIEKSTISKCLAHYFGNISAASNALGVGRATVYRKLKEFDLDPKSFRENKGMDLENIEVTVSESHRAI